MDSTRLKALVAALAVVIVTCAAGYLMYRGWLPMAVGGPVVAFCLFLLSQMRSAMENPFPRPPDQIQ